MINPQWLELPMSRTNFHGPKDVQAIEVRLYLSIRSLEQTPIQTERGPRAGKKTGNHRSCLPCKKLKIYKAYRIFKKILNIVDPDQLVFREA